MRIILTGSCGQLGREISILLSSRKSFYHQVFRDELHLIEVNSSQLDITNQNETATLIKSVKPSLIINCAAYTNVDQAEEAAELAYQVNALGPKNLALGAGTVGAKLVHISTDYVFDGRGIWQGNQLIPYGETDKTNPINVYGKTKLAGEIFVRDLCSQSFILRTAWLYGEKGPNFVKTIMAASKRKERLQVVHDQFGCPTNAADLAAFLLDLAATEAYGLYHCTGKGSCSWFEFASKIVSLSGGKAMVEPIDSGQLTRRALRPQYAALDNQRLEAVLGKTMPPWEASLEAFIKNMPTS